MKAVEYFREVMKHLNEVSYHIYGQVIELVDILIGDEVEFVAMLICLLTSRNRGKWGVSEFPNLPSLLPNLNLSSTSNSQMHNAYLRYLHSSSSWFLTSPKMSLHLVVINCA